MSTLDEILDRMNARGAECLQFKTGEIPQVFVQGRAHALQRDRITAAQLLLLARTIADADATLRMDRRIACSFQYRGFVFRLSFPNGQPELVVSPGKRVEVPELISNADRDEVGIGKRSIAAGTGPHEQGSETEPDDYDHLELDPERNSIPPEPGRSSHLPAEPTGHGQAIATKETTGKLSIPPRAGAKSYASIRPPKALPLPLLVVGKAATFVRTHAIGLTMCVFVAAGAYLYFRPTHVANVRFQTSRDQPSLDEIRGERRYLVVVFLPRDCQISRYTLGVAKEAAPLVSERVAFMGVYFGTQSEAEAYGQNETVSFPIYGMQDIADRSAADDLAKKAGANDPTGAGANGSVLLLDSSNAIVEKMNRANIDTLAQRLSTL